MTIECRFTKRLGDFTLSVDFESTWTLAIFGPSGSGKTSLLDCIAGFSKPDDGIIREDGKWTYVDTQHNFFRPARDRGVGFVQQENFLFPHLTVEKNLRYGARRRKLTGPTDFDDVVRFLDIAPLLSRYPHRLSGGEKKRVAIGRALLSRPRLLLLDEPMASLDPIRKSELLPFIDRLSDRGRYQMLYVTHDADEILRLADDIVVLDKGRMLAHGPVAEILSCADLQALFGWRCPGVVVKARVVKHDPSHGLTEIAVAQGQLRIPIVDVEPGRDLHVRLAADNVLLATEEPQTISALNRFPGEVTGIDPRAAGAVDVTVALSIGLIIHAQITPTARENLRLEPGQKIWALIKATALHRPLEQTS